MGGFKVKARWQISTWLFVTLVTVYHVNLDFLPGDDATPNIYLPISIIEHGSMGFAPSDFPFMFEWRERGPFDPGARTLSIDGWLPQVKDWPESIGREPDQLSLVRERYYVIPSARAGFYANTFGIGAGLFALPLFVAADWMVGLDSAPVHFPWFVGKLAASLAVAGSAVVILLTAWRFCGLIGALVLALSYGVGTCVWSISSQTLWQHGPNELCLAGAGFFWLKPQDRNWNWFWCGMALSLAVLCRPTSGIVVIALGGWLVCKNWRACLTFVAGGLPMALVLFCYNWFVFGDPFAFGQTERGHSVALEKTGSDALWSTPLAEGLSGLLVSPSRGLFVYSPFLLFGLAGVWRIWRIREYAMLRPLTLAVLAMLLVASKWFDWWGGWTYGYRPIVDTMPFLILFLLPMIPAIRTGGWRRSVFGIFLAWSILVQFVGAFAYDLISWHKGKGMNIDRPENRHRLWSWTECEIVYYMRHFSEAQARRPGWRPFSIWDGSMSQGSNANLSDQARGADLRSAGFEASGLFQRIASGGCHYRQTGGPPHGDGRWIATRSRTLMSRGGRGNGAQAPSDSK